MMNIFIVFFISLCLARPERPPMQEGEVRNFKNQKRFTYNNNDNLKGSTRKPYDYQYDIELKDGFHSLDDEEEIEDVKCFSDYLEIYTTTKDIINWKNGDSISGSEMWNCGSTIARKIEYVDYEGEVDGLHKFYVKTGKAELSDFFENAKVKLENHVSMEEVLKKKVELKEIMKQQQNDEEGQTPKEHVVEFVKYTPEEKIKRKEERNQMKHQINHQMKESELKGGVTFTLISPEAKSYREMSEGIMVNFEIKGCTESRCRNLILRFDFAGVVDNGFDDDLGYWEFEHDCGTSGECVGRYRFTSSYQPNFQANLRVYFYVTVKDSNGNTIVSKIDYEKEFFYLNTYYVLFISPAASSVVEAKESTEIKFEISQRIKDDSSIENLRINICESEIGIDDCDWWFTISKTQSVVYIDLTDTRVFEPGGEYYFKTTVKGFTTEGDVFLIAEVDPPVVLTSPTAGGFYKSGDKLDIEWVCNNPDIYGSLSLDIYIKYAKKFAIDPKTLIGTYRCDEDYRTIRVNLGNVIPSNEYYVDITYKLPNKIFKSHATSGYFAINVPQRTQLTRTQHDKDNNRLRIFYKVSEWVGTVYVSVKEQYPSIFPLNPALSGTQEKTISSYYTNSESYIDFFYNTGTIFKTYVEFKYDCVVKNYLCTTERYIIEDSDIPYSMDLSFNLDSYHNVATKTLKLFDFGCGVDEDEESKSIMQSVCDYAADFVGIGFALSSYCNDCYFDIDFGMKNFELDMDLAQVQKFRFEIDAAFDYYINLVNTIKGKFSSGIKVPIPIPAPVRIPTTPLKIVIGPVRLTFGPTFGLAVGLDIEAEAMLQTVGTFRKQHVVSFIFDTALTNKYQVVSTTPNDEYNNFEVYGSASITITPKLIAQIGFICKLEDYTVINTAIGLSFGFEFEVAYSNPPFSSSSYYGTNYPHYLRLDNKFFISFDAEFAFIELFTGSFSKELFAVSKGFGFLEYQSGTKPISFVMKISKELSDFDKSIFQYEIGSFLNQLGFTQYNPYDVSVNKIGDNKYEVQLMSNVATETMARKTVDKIQSIKKSSSNDRTFTYSIRNSITLCEISHCETCSLDLSKCEKCESGYSLKNGVCEENKPEEPENPSNPDQPEPKECVENKNKMNGYAVEKDDEYGEYNLYKFDYCYEENDVTFKYTYDKSKSRLTKCEYSNGYENCANSNLEVYLSDSDLPNHSNYMIMGDETDCSDHTNGASVIVLYVEKCISNEHGYYKYQVVGNSVYIQMYTDSNCNNPSTDDESSMEIMECGECDYSMQMYCSKLTIASNSNDEYEPESTECKNSNKLKGYVVMTEDSDYGETILYKLDYCYGSNPVSKYTYDESSRSLYLCEYSNGNVNCDKNDKEVILSDSSLPQHIYFMIMGEEDDCSDHRTGAVTTVLFSDVCIYEDGEYFKYEYDGDNVYIAQYSDPICDEEGKTSMKHVVNSCDSCTDGIQAYCSQHSIEHFSVDGSSITSILLIFLLCFFLF